jgi:hypothetical protein
MLLLAGSAGALANPHLVGNKSPQDITPVKVQVDEPEAGPAAQMTGTDDEWRDFMWVQNSTRMGRTRGRTITSSFALRRPKDAFEADGSLTVELSPSGSSSRSNGLEEDPIFSSDGRIVVPEIGAFHLKEAKDSMERPHKNLDLQTDAFGMEVDSCSDHQVSHDGLGWEGHKIH